MPNTSGGILVGGGVSGAGTNTRIGGIEPGAGNVIAFNGGPGVTVRTTQGNVDPIGNAILGNSIFSNTGLGIDLGGDGVTSVVAVAGLGPNNGQKAHIAPITRSTSFGRALTRSPRLIRAAIASQRSITGTIARASMWRYPSPGGTGSISPGSGDGARGRDSPTGLLSFSRSSAEDGGGRYDTQVLRVDQGRWRER